MSDDIFLDRFELNDATAQAILKSGEVQAALLALANPIAATAESSGGTFAVRVVHWPARTAVQVWTADFAARQAEATSRALTRAIGG